MVQINPLRREVNCKIVYYGPGLSGKTTNLEIIHQKTPDANKGKLTAVATEQDRTLFFDFMPMDIGMVAGMQIKLRLFTVPGQVFYNATRRIVLQGVDGVVFVADSQRHKFEENLESLQNLKDNLKEYGRTITEIPLVLQWNKRDLPNVLPLEELENRINNLKAPSLPAVATAGKGVFPTLKKCIAEVLALVTRELGHQQAETEKKIVKPVGPLRLDTPLVQPPPVQPPPAQPPLAQPPRVQPPTRIQTPAPRTLKPIRVGKQEKKKKLGKMEKPKPQDE